MRLTYDPSLPEYTIAIRLAAPWPEAGNLRHCASRGRGPQQRSRTARHVLSSDGRTLSVSDRGFGNVLDGLEFNAMALAASGERAVPIDLEGAAPEVAAFRACITAPTA